MTVRIVYDREVIVTLDMGCQVVPIKAVTRG